MAVTLDAIVLPAFDDLDGLPGEATPWGRAYNLDEQLAIPGVPSPLRYSTRGVGVVPTGIGKAAAATTTTALLSSDRLDLADASILTVGVAGGPSSVPIGSVVISEQIVDWDDKIRLDPEPGDHPLAPNPYTVDQGHYELGEELIRRIRELSEPAELERPAEVDEERSADPEIMVGTNLSGDELWHGTTLAEEASWLVEQYDAAPYLVTEMEDAGTAAALDRFDRLESYCSVRGVSNHDRPRDDQTARESFFGDEFESGFAVAVENAVSVAKPFVDATIADT